MQFDEDTYIKFGTALPVLEEDDVQSRKPINVEDQIATDENGRRRFHGAFTGGFSAGFWNTVGSLEGWKPQEFKSSRQEKATRKRQCVDDFMDDEDKGEFGIAPQRVQAKADYSKAEDLPNKKQKLSSVTGPIPGVPVLQSLLKPARDNIATRLLKQMGWREGQGIGARQTKAQKKRAQSRNQKELYIMEKYGCDLASDRPSTSRPSQENDPEAEDSESDEEITFAPDDFDPFLATIKENTFGYGYSGLDRNPILGKRFNLFQPLEILDKNNKKLSISGQAFGVGAFEAEDDDIYERDDMTKYDFSLEDQKKRKRDGKSHVLAIQQGALEGFEAPQSQERGKYKNKVYKVSVPREFEARNWTERRSRFDRLPEEKERELQQQNNYKLKGLGRHDLNPEQRSALLNEGASTLSSSSLVPPPVESPVVKDSPRNSFLAMINKKYESFEKSAEIVNEKSSHPVDVEAQRALTEARKKTEGMPMVQSTRKFKPFPQDLAKQRRYDQFCEFPLSSDAEMAKFLATIQPVELSQWDREMERKEFVQARKLFRPLDGLMLNRFVTETELNAQRNKEEEEAEGKKEQEQQQKEPEKGQKEVQMKRVKAMWKPDALLCKRFNVPEPFGGAMAATTEEKTKGAKSKYSVFDYLEVSVNTKEAFVTPIVRPSEKSRGAREAEEKKKVTEDLEREEATTVGLAEGRMSTKALFERELRPAVGTPQLAVKSRERPRSELEQQSIALKDTHPAEKKDLFKAIFDSSDSEEEEEGKDKKEEEEQVTIPKPDISELLKKSATEINILRNNSPPRGIFANLFKRPSGAAAAAVVEKVKDAIKVEEVTDTRSEAVVVVAQKKDSNDQPPKIMFRRKEDRETIKRRNSDDEEEDKSFFGPKPPPATVQGRPKSRSLFDTQRPGQSEDKLDRKLAEALQGKDMKIVEEWVERDKMSSKKKKSKDKKDKKHKKEKKLKKEKKNKEKR